MKPAPIPADDTSRLTALSKTLLLDTPDEHAFDCVTAVGAALFSTPVCLISLVGADRQWFKSCVGLNVRETARDISFCGHVVADHDVLVVEDALRDPRFADNPVVTGPPGVRFYAGCPIREPGGRILGSLCVIDFVPRRLPAKDVPLLRSLATLAEQVIAARSVSQSQRVMLRKLEDARRASLIDPLLRVWNREGIMRLLAEQRVIAARNRKPFCLMMADVDRFKLVNDQHGHQAGDALLAAITKAVRSAVRSGDDVGRYGGDELLILLPDAAGDCAADLASRIATAVRSTTLEVGNHKIGCSLSIGLAAWSPLRPETVESLLRRADLALLEAKRHGRDRIVSDDVAA